MCYEDRTTGGKVSYEKSSITAVEQESSKDIELVLDCGDRYPKDIYCTTYACKRRPYAYIIHNLPRSKFSKAVIEGIIKEFPYYGSNDLIISDNESIRHFVGFIVDILHRLKHIEKEFNQIQINLEPDTLEDCTRMMQIECNKVCIATDTSISALGYDTNMLESVVDFYFGTRFITVFCVKFDNVKDTVFILINGLEGINDGPN